VKKIHIELPDALRVIGFKDPIHESSLESIRVQWSKGARQRRFVPLFQYPDVFQF
jgi:hypothetical protein